MNPKNPGGPEPRFMAGTAKREITIEKPGIVVNDPLFAKVLVLDDGGTQVVIIAMDAVAIGGIADVRDDFLPSLRARIQEELGIPGKHVLVNASHTHPSNEILCEPDELLSRVFDAVREAKENMVAATAGAGRGFEGRISINRVLRLKNGRNWTIRHGIPCPPDDEVLELGPIDPEIGLLRIDRLDGGVLAVIYNFACHTLIGVPSGAVTANFPGFASQVIEEAFPGGMALFLQGAAGDVTELLYKDVNRPRDARPLGAMLGSSVVSAVRSIQTVPAAIKLIHENLVFPLWQDSDERIAEVEDEQRELLNSLRYTSLNFKALLPLYLKHALNPLHPSDYSYRYLQEEKRGCDDLAMMDEENRRNLQKYLANIRAMEKLSETVDSIETLKKHRDEIRKLGGKSVPSEVIGLRVGDFVLITSAAEVFTEIGIGLKRESPHPFTFLSAFTNGYLHYGAPAADYSKRFYEVTECMLAPEWEQLFKSRARDILVKLS